MRRTPEPELMDSEEQAKAYAEADFDEPNSLFCRLVAERVAEAGHATRVVDLGCGPADIAIRLARQNPSWRVTAVDGSRAMLSLAERAVRASRIADRVELVEGCIPAVDLGGGFDVVVSNSLLHHLPDPQSLWGTLRRITTRPAQVAVMDLVRPASRQSATHLVDLYARDEPEILRYDFFHSLLAAFTIDEVQRQLVHAELTTLSVERVSDRHLFVWGALPDSPQK